MVKPQADKVFSAQNIVQAYSTAAQDLLDFKGFEAQFNVTVNSPGALTFAADTDVDVTANTAVITAHGLFVGQKFALSGSGLPTGLSATTYYTIVVDANTIKFADSVVHANAGTAIDITIVGTGTATVTPSSLSSATVKIEKSLDGTNWADFASATSISGSAVVAIGCTTSPFYSRYIRGTFAMAAGSLTADMLIVTK